MTQAENIDPEEIAKFNALAESWWDPLGQSRPLHQINPVRMDFIENHCALNNKIVLDVGCGGGILTEAMAKSGAKCTAIDMGQQAVDIARLHALDSELNIDYQVMTVEQKAIESPGQYDIVTCMEMLEHVPDPLSVVNACYQLVKPGGSVFFSTINRHPKAYLFAVLGAEYLLKLLPIGTHDYQRFIRPSELAQWCRQAELSVEDLKGISYRPGLNRFYLSNDLKVNYLIHCRRALDL